jgi:hypothetical protein
VKQTTFASLAWANKGKVTRREAYTMFALANLYLIRGRLMLPGEKCALGATNTTTSISQAGTSGWAERKTPRFPSNQQVFH